MAQGIHESYRQTAHELLIY